jgi:hypothetical protein
MKQDKTKNTEKVSTKKQDDNSPVLDKKLLADVIYELNICRKNFLIYPVGHVQTKQSIEKCHTLIHSLLELAPKITIGAAKEKLFVGNVLIEDKAHSVKDLALAFKEHEFARITFYQKISDDDLACFFRLMAKDPEEVEGLGGFDKALAANGTDTIKIKFIDYSKFHHTEEKEINRTEKQKLQTEESSIWTEYISNLLTGSLSTSGQGIPVKRTKGIHPSQLAIFLNENKIDPGVALETYRTTLSRRLQEADPTVTASSANANNFCEFDLLLQELNPTLKKQFLSTTYNQLNLAGEDEATENVLTDFSEQVVVDMLRQANEDGEEISPSLMNLVYKITSAHDGMDHQEGEKDSNEIPNPIDLLSDTAPLQNIFARENFEEYVTTDYENTLSQLSGEIDTQIAEANESFPLEEYYKELEPSHLDAQITRIILAFMNNDIEPAEYENYSVKVVEIAYDLLGTGGFATLLKIFNALFQHYKFKSNPEIQSLAKKTLKKFREARFTSMAVVSFEKWAQFNDTAAYAFLKSMGSIIVPEMVVLYGKRERPEIQSLVLDLLKRFPEATGREAKKRFYDPRPSFVINMLTLIRKVGTEKDTPYIAKLLEHHDIDVRITALEALIEFGDPDGPDLIRSFLRSRSTDETSKVIQLIGTYKVADLVPDLTSKLSRWALFKSQCSRNEKIITALGKIGDSKAIPILEKLAKRRWVFWKKNLNRMKLALFESLHGYELSHISSLLKIGQMSQDNRIRQLCQKIGKKNEPVQSG